MPSPETQAHSDRLRDHIRQEITLAGGQISFARYMELALYAPGLGYYSAGATKFGASGDFITAPELSPLFSRCLARQCQQILAAYDKADILELGAGSGVMASDILLELEAQQCLPENYYILEVSADLRQRQENTLRARMPHLFDRVHWLDHLPTQKITGVILANEVLDAMPVARFRLEENQLSEFYVRWENNKFTWHLDKPSSRLIEQIDALPQEIKQNLDDYESEINLNLTPWIQSLSDTLEKGLILLIDYGFLQHEFYHPDRNRGTLMCHHQHRAHTDPLVLVGLQDITAHVDFTAVANAAMAANLDIAGYTSQARFLLNCGLLDMINTSANTEQQWQLNQQIKKLTLPHEMGELFKVMGLTRAWVKPLMGYG